MRLDHLGVVRDPDGEGVAGGGTCDDRVRITLALSGDRLARVRVAADACATATATALDLARRAEGEPLLAAAALVPVSDAPCALTALDALHAALGDAVVRGARVGGRDAIAVAMSGGVDSAVALARAAGAGRPVVGLTLRLWIDPQAPAGDRVCCAPAAVRSARATCHARGLPHLQLDLRESFRATVVERFVAGYAAGETPNPCMTCNGDFRFGALVDAARRLGASELHTGHYARIVEHDGVRLIARGVDRDKDQAYMLARIEPALLETVRFPLGETVKAQVRAEAAALGLEAATARESQEVCFLGGGQTRDFLRRQGVAFGPGTIEDERGAVVGSHDGAAGFTRGQRRGLGVGAGEPLYVARTDPARNVVVLAPRDRLRSTAIDLRDVALYAELPVDGAQVRHRSPVVAATLDGARGRLALSEPVFAATTGQTAALYAGDVVVGAGTIARS